MHVIHNVFSKNGRLNEDVDDSQQSYAGVHGLNKTIHWRRFVRNIDTFSGMIKNTEAICSRVL